MPTESSVEPVWFRSFRETLDERLAAIEDRLANIEEKVTHSEAPGQLHSMTSSEEERDRSVTTDEYSAMVDRRVKALLGKLTMENFDAVSDQVVAWANKSESEMDGRTLLQVTHLVYDMAIDDSGRSEIYARLSRKIMERTSPQIQAQDITDGEGKPVVGGNLFRKRLLNRCQEGFERGWDDRDVNQATHRRKFAGEDSPFKSDERLLTDNENQEVYLGEGIAAQRGRRQRLGVTVFICELFKVQMLTERIMHECLKMLLRNINNPPGEAIESLCTLLTTTGAVLDTPKVRARMDLYFSRMAELAEGPDLGSKERSMLQEVIALRVGKWESVYSAGGSSRSKDQAGDVTGAGRLPRGNGSRGEGTTIRSVSSASPYATLGRVDDAAP